MNVDGNESMLYVKERNNERKDEDNRGFLINCSTLVCDSKKYINITL
jgi:hypothetical protein